MTDNSLTPEELNSFSEWLPKFLEEAAHHQETINRQKAEIERLKNNQVVHIDINEQFRKECEHEIKTAVTEAVKDLAEAVKMAFYYEFDELIPSIMADKIDELVKERVGEG